MGAAGGRCGAARRCAERGRHADVQGEAAARGAGRAAGRAAAELHVPPALPAPRRAARAGRSGPAATRLPSRAARARPRGALGLRLGSVSHFGVFLAFGGRSLLFWALLSFYSYFSLLVFLWGWSGRF